MPIRSSSALLLGLPGSGKTTFLAALWHVAESAEIDPSLKVTQLAGDRKYLNDICGVWRRCEPADRTLATMEQRATLILTDGTEETELEIPDMSGESFEHYFKYRRWPRAFDDIARRCGTILLFVHPLQLVEATTISVANKAAAALPPMPSSAESEEGQPWDVGLTPTQVKLVDLLQLLRFAEVGASRRVVVIVSAWDLVGGDPREWLRARLPLLDQYLRANQESEQVIVYGISAQGGRLPEDKERLASVARPSDRISVVGPGASQHDVTSPLRSMNSPE